MRVIDWTEAPQSLEVGATSAAFGAVMDASALHRDNTVYQYTCDVASWIKQSADDAVVATAGTDGELYVPANASVFLSPRDGGYLAVIQVDSAGTATLALTRRV